MPDNSGQMSFDDNTESILREFEREVRTLVNGVSNLVTSNQALTRNFDKQIMAMNLSMQKIIDSNSNLISAMKGIKPPVGGARTSTKDSQPTQPQGSSSQPQPRPFKSGSQGGGLTSRYDYIAEEEHDAFGTSAIDAPPPGQSNDPTNASQPPTTFANLMNGGNNWFTKGMTNSVNYGARSTPRLPRYGEFNTQDLFRLFSDVSANVAMGITNNAADEEGNLPEGFNSSPSGIIAKGLGGLTRVSDLVSNIVPYTRAFQQLTGIPNSLGGQVAEGTQMGYAQGGMNVGPFRVPGINIDPFSSGFGISPAAQQGLANSWQAFTYGLMPGGSSKLMTEMQNSLQQYGWSGSTMRNIARQWGNVQRNEQYGDIGSPQELAPVLDQMLRQGGGGISNVVTALEALPDAAKAANQSISQTIDGLNNFAQAQVALGSTYYQGFTGGAAMQASTGLPSAVNQSILSSPLGQGLTSEETGVPIPVIGTASVTSQFNGARQALDYLYKSFKDAGWTNKQAAAYAGQVSGMNLNSQQVQDIINHGGKMESAMKLTEQASNLQTSIHNLKNARTPKDYRAAYNKILKTRGKKAADTFAQNTSVNEWSQGRGGPSKRGTEHIINSKAWHEAEAGGEWNSTMPTLRKDAYAAGMSKKTFNSMTDSSKKNIDTLDQKIKDWASKRANSYNDTNGQASVTIELSSQAKKLLQFATSSNKNASNNGQTSVNIPYATSQYPQSGVSANLGTVNGNP